MKCFLSLTSTNTTFSRHSQTDFLIGHSAISEGISVDDRAQEVVDGGHLKDLQLVSAVSQERLNFN
jgi:hypothetical protein